MSKTLTLRIDDETYEEFVEQARAENRSVANFIENAVKERIREHDFVDDFEMAGIRADEALVRRLRKGSLDVKKRKGTMIG
jgi:predicted transcriptional regulator